jgi:hypothetical protein
MRIVLTSLILFFFIVCTSMTQCNRCTTGRLVIENDSKRWLPYRGKDTVVFVTQTGIEKKCKARFADTTKDYLNACQETFSADSVGASLEINAVDSLNITTQIAAPSWICLRATDRNTYYLGGCNLLYGSESEMRKSYSVLRLNNFQYSNVILVNAYPGTNPAFDSIYYAKDYGVVSFRYNNVRLFLKQ